MIKKTFIILLCFTVSSCATYRTIARTSYEIENSNFDNTRKYKIVMKDKSSFKTKGNLIVGRESNVLHFNNKEGETVRSINIEDIKVIKQKKISALLTGGVILVGLYVLVMTSIGIALSIATTE